MSSSLNQVQLSSKQTWLIRKLLTDNVRAPANKPKPPRYTALDQGPGATKARRARA
jgi:hypothetical protein